MAHGERHHARRASGARASCWQAGQAGRRAGGMLAYLSRDVRPTQIQVLLLHIVIHELELVPVARLRAVSGRLVALEHISQRGHHVGHVARSPHHDLVHGLPGSKRHASRDSSRGMRKADGGGVAGEAREEEGGAGGLTWWVFEKRRRASCRRTVLIHLSPTARPPASQTLHACLQALQLQVQGAVQLGQARQAGVQTCREACKHARCRHRQSRVPVETW